MSSSRSRRPAADRVEVEEPLRVVLGDPHAAVRGRVDRYVGVLVHRDAAAERRGPQQPVAERHRPPARELPVDAERPIVVGVEGLPVETWIVRTTWLSSIASTSWRSISTSTRCPAGPCLMTVGRWAEASAVRVRSSTAPVRGSPCHFWNAITAAVVPGPRLAVDPGREQVAEVGERLLERARARRRGAARWGDRARGRDVRLRERRLVRGTVASTPGNSPSGVPPLMSSSTRGHAGHGGHRADDLVEPGERRVDGVPLEEADAEVDRRDVAVQGHAAHARVGGHVGAERLLGLGGRRARDQRRERVLHRRAGPLHGHELLALAEEDLDGRRRAGGLRADAGAHEDQRQERRAACRARLQAASYRARFVVARRWS